MYMPVILRFNKIRFVFFSNDHLPIHIHAIYGKNLASCKIITSTLEVEDNIGFSNKDLKLLKNIVEKNKKLIEDEWNEFFKR